MCGKDLKMTEKRITKLLKDHNIKTRRINDKLYVEEYYMLWGKIYSELPLVNPELKTVGGEPILKWLGY